ncbi:MAG: hypothetical protein ABIH99_03560 [Candidatus Micrarchaeota archaeon]
MKNVKFGKVLLIFAVICSVCLLLFGCTGSGAKNENETSFSNESNASSLTNATNASDASLPSSLPALNQSNTTNASKTTLTANKTTKSAWKTSYSDFEIAQIFVLALLAMVAGVMAKNKGEKPLVSIIVAFIPLAVGFGYNFVVGIFTALVEIVVLLSYVLEKE